jgi:hypothetical protein
MVHLKSLVRVGARKIGLVLVREQGLDLEVWDGRTRPCWSLGIVRAEGNSPGPQEVAARPRVPRWLLVLPTYLCTTRVAQLPASRADELAAMLEFEVPQLVPCRTQSWTWDYCIMDRGPDGATQVLVILAPLSVVESALEQVHSLGIEPCLVTVSAALWALRPARDRGPEPGKLRAHLWWEHGCLDFWATEGSRLVFVRGVRLGGRDSQALDGVPTEAEHSLSLLRERGFRGALSVQVGGSEPEVPALLEKLRQSAAAHADQACTWEAEDADAAGSGMPGAAAWRNGRTHLAALNLLPKHRKEKDRRARHQRELLGIGLRACSLALLLLLCLRLSVWRQTRLLGQYQQRLAQIAPLAQRLQFLQGQLNMIRTQVQGSVSMLDIIGQMYEVLPQDVTIHYLSIDEDRQVVMRAQAKWLSQAFDCIDPLERSAYLVNVRQNYAHLRELEGQVLIDFELRADLERHVAREAQP